MSCSQAALISVVALNRNDVMVCKCLDKSKAQSKHTKAFVLCLVEAETTAKLLEGVTD